MHHWPDKQPRGPQTHTWYKNRSRRDEIQALPLVHVMPELLSWRTSRLLVCKTTLKPELHLQDQGPQRDSSHGSKEPSDAFPPSPPFLHGSPQNSSSFSQSLPDFGIGDIQLQVHKVSFPTLVQLTVLSNHSQEGVLGIKWPGRKEGPPGLLSCRLTVLLSSRYVPSVSRAGSHY